ncbi:single-stranded DNA-binding protein [Paenarthrobacter sp. NPDC090520]|uniref:single-stranded DNA-binding protein n=1 Tax=Paenarthrobacter sp. NPDC090520 TaxID=3364382 RepID=UPI003829A985
MDSQHYRGNIGSAVVLETTKGSNVPYLKIRIAVNDSYVDSDGQQHDRETFWLNTELWRGLASRAAELFKSGDPVIVVGKWRSSTFEVEGKKRTRNYFVADTIAPDMAYADVSGVQRIERRAESATPAQGREVQEKPAESGSGFKEPETENPFE